MLVLSLAVVAEPGSLKCLDVEVYDDFRNGRASIQGKRSAFSFRLMYSNERTNKRTNEAKLSILGQSTERPIPTSGKPSVLRGFLECDIEFIP